MSSFCKKIKKAEVEHKNVSHYLIHLEDLHYFSLKEKIKSNFRCK